MARLFSWWDRPTCFALLTILLWASVAALTSRITSISPLVLVGLVLFICGAGALPFWRQWRASPRSWLVTIAALLFYHLLLFMSFRHAPVLEANLINYLWPLCIMLFTPLLLPNHPLKAHHLLAAIFGLAGSLVVILNGEFQLQQEYLMGYLLAFGAAIIWGLYSVLSRRLPPAPAVVTAAACLPAGVLALSLAWLLEGPLPLAQIALADWLLIIGLGLGPMGAAFITWYLALRDGDPRRIAALAYLTPLLSTLLLVVLNDEAFTLRHLLSASLIIGGALLGMVTKSTISHNERPTTSTN